MHARQRVQHKFSKHWALGKIEEVGVDIAEAIAVLDIYEEKPLKKDDATAQKWKKSHERSTKLFKSIGKFTADILPHVKLAPVKKGNNEDFASELRNESQNAPIPSSKSLSRFLKQASPSLSKNVVFQDNVTEGHARGAIKKCLVNLTPQVLSIRWSGKTQHIVLEDIHQIVLDECHQMCTIFAANSLNGPLTLENFPGQRLDKFLLILSYLAHLGGSQLMIYQFSWNYMLKRQKMPPVMQIFPVTLFIESGGCYLHKLEQEILYKIQMLDHDDNEQDALELCEGGQSWEKGYWLLKLNSLYLSSKKGEEYPMRFWLLSQMKALTELDSDVNEFLLELAFENEVLLLKFSNAEEVLKWRTFLQKAKEFQPSTFYSGESVTQVHEILLAIDAASTIIAFNVDQYGKVVRKDLLLSANVTDVLLSPTKPECSLVIIRDFAKIVWRVVLKDFDACGDFIHHVRRLCKNV